MADHSVQALDILAILLRDGIIRPITNADFNPQQDIEQAADEIIRRMGSLSRTTSVKQQEALKRLEIDKLVREWRDQAEIFAKTSQIAGQKRTRSADPEDSTVNKRRKVYQKQPNGMKKAATEAKMGGIMASIFQSNSHATHTDLSQLVAPIVSSNISLRPNYDKYSVTKRNQGLLDLATERLGENVAQIYAAVLRIVERQTARCYDIFEIGSGDEDPDVLTLQHSPPATAHEILEELENTTDLEVAKTLTMKPNGFPRANGLNGHASEEKQYQSDTIIDQDADEDEPIRKRARWAKQDDHEDTLRTLGTVDSTLKKMESIESSLEILRVSPERFLRRQGTSYTVPYGHLTPILMLETVLEHITGLLGTLYARVVRLLAWSGNCDEKIISQRAMIPMRDLRPILAKLLEAGFIELYPVARDSQRTASRALYIYCFSMTTVRVKIIGNGYKSMARLLQRLEVEKQKESLLLEKVQRSDVRGHEQQYLTARELDALEKFRVKEARILQHVDLIDELVGKLRDWWPMYRYVPTLRLDDFRLGTVNAEANRSTKDAQEKHNLDSEEEEIVEGRLSEPLGLESD